MTPKARPANSHTLRLLWSSSLFFVFSCFPSYALVTTDPTNQPALNWRFLGGIGTANPTPNTDPSFVGLGYDWSGIGGTDWGLTTGRVKSAAILSPIHMETAAHYFWDVGTQPDFFNGQTSERITATVAAQKTIAGDVNLATLAKPFAASDHIAVMRLLDISSGNYANQPGFILGTGNKASGQLTGVQQIATIITGSVYGSGTSGGTISVSGNSTTHPNLTYISSEIGDSGSPLLITYKGQLTMAGSTGNAIGTSSTLLNQPTSVAITNTRMATDGYALRYTVYDVPTDTANTANAWTGGAGTSAFSSSSNWSRGSAPNNLPVVFDSSAAGGQRRITLGSDQAVRGILFHSNSNLTGGFTVDAGNTLFVGTSGIRNEDSNTQTIHSAIALTGAQNWEAANGDLVFNGNIANNGNLLVVQGTANTTIGGIVSGAGGLAKDEAGTLTLNGQNTYTGTTFIHDGTLRVGTNNALPTSTNVRFDAANPSVLDLNGKAQTVGKISSVYNGSGTIALNGGALTVGGINQFSSYSGVFTGSGSVTKVGTSTLVLGGNSSGYTGTTVVNGGELRVENATGSATGSGSVTVNQGGTLSGRGIIDGGIVLNAGATLSPGFADAGGLTVNGGMVWNGGAGLAFTLSSLGNSTYMDLGSSALTKGSAGSYQFSFANGGGLSTGIYNLISFGSTNFSTSDFSYTNASGVAGNFLFNAGNLQFQVTNAGTPSGAIFKADFNGSGTGTGGANDIVSFGGTGTKYQYTTATTTVSSSPTLGQGNFLKVEVGANPSNGYLGGVNLTPASRANSWAAMNTVSGGVATLHGAADFFFREDATVAGGLDIFDIGSETNGGIRLILQQNQTGTRLRLYNGDNGFLTGSTYATADQNAIIDAAFTPVAGTTYHLGFTLYTDPETGISEMRMFRRADTGAIDLTSTADLVGKLTFKINGDIITTGLSADAFAFNLGGNSYNQDAAGRQIDGDALSLYDTVPLSFAAVPEPGTVGLFGLGLLVLFSRNRKRAGTPSANTHRNAACK